MIATGPDFGAEAGSGLKTRKTGERLEDAAFHLSPGGRGYKITVLDRQGQVVDFVGEGDGVTPLVQCFSPHLRFLALG